MRFLQLTGCLKLILIFCYLIGQAATASVMQCWQALLQWEGRWGIWGSSPHRCCTMLSPVTTMVASMSCLSRGIVILVYPASCWKSSFSWEDMKVLFYGGISNRFVYLGQNAWIKEKDDYLVIKWHEECFVELNTVEFQLNRASNSTRDPGWEQYYKIYNSVKCYVKTPCPTFNELWYHFGPAKI